MKPRQHNTFEAGIVEAIAKLGADQCATIIGRSASFVYQSADPDSDRNLSIQMSCAIDVACLRAGHEKAPILEAYAAQVAQINAPVHTPCARSDRMATLAREFGEALTAFSEIRDERVSVNDGHVVIKELLDIREAVDAAIRDVEVAMGVEPANAAE